MKLKIHVIVSITLPYNSQFAFSILRKICNQTLPHFNFVNTSVEISKKQMNYFIDFQIVTSKFYSIKLTILRSCQVLLCLKVNEFY